MADFLANIVERNLGDKPDLQPMIAPLFAPQPQTLLPVDETLDTLDLETKSTPSVAPHQRIHSAIPEMPAVQSTAPLNAMLFNSTAHHEPATIIEHHSHSELQPITRAEVLGTANAAGTANTKPVSAAGVGNTKSVNAAVAGNTAPVSSPEHEPNFLERIIERRETQPLVVPARTPVEQQFNTRGDKQINVSRVEVANLPSHTQPQEAQTPTINVSIGRIEIRASAAPQTAAAKPQVNGAMPLDEYLRRRRGGAES